MLRVVAIRETSQHYHDGDSVFTGYNVVRWDGEREEIDRTTYGPATRREDMPEVDKEASAAWHLKQLAYESECRRIEAEMRQTEMRLNDAYHVRSGRTVRTIKGRKVPVGTVTVCRSNAVQSTFNRYQSNVSTDRGWTSTNNLECVPTAGEFPAEMRCPGCEKVRAGVDYVFSGWEGFGRANRGVEWCRYCAAASYANTDHGTDAHTLALAVLAGDLSAICPLVDALIEDGNDYRADELKRLHKLDKPARKPRKAKKVEAVAAV